MIHVVLRVSLCQVAEFIDKDEQNQVGKYGSGRLLT